MNLENYLNKKVKISQVKSSSKLNQKQQSCLIGLGLRGIGSSSELKVDNSILGMIKKVFHIIKIS
jgi:ribosomal protein L30